MALALIREHIADGKVLALIDGFLRQPIFGELETWTPDAGSPQGAVISPLLSNLYLNPLDHVMAQAGLEMVRYADDFVVLCRSKAEAERALEVIQRWTAEAGLRLHPTKTRLVDVMQPGGFDFLGYYFERGQKNPNKIHHWPCKKSLKKLKDAIRSHTKRANGYSSSDIIGLINPILRGWFEYFKHSPRANFERLDGWVRMRLRSILRKRSRRRGRGRGKDHQRWPNRFFMEHGLFSLTAAHAAICQSSSRRTTNWRAGCRRTARPVRREGRPG